MRCEQLSNRHLFFNLMLLGAVWLPLDPCVADEITSGEGEFFQELPIVLTASRLTQPLSEAPSPMTVIDKEMIKASGFRSIPELMRLVPGMYVGFADANRPVVSFHGSQDELARRMQILIDGRSIYMPPHGGVRWADLPLFMEDIERIEVVRGPSSASHGTNSFYGVINIITKDALGQNGTNIAITKGGSTSDASARFGKVGERYDYRFSAGYRSDQGISNKVLNDHSVTNIFDFRSNYHPDITNNLDIQIGSSNGVYGTGVLDVPMQNTPGWAGLTRPEDPFRDIKSSTDFVQLSWQHLWPTADESKVTYAYSTHDSFDPNICINAAICQGQNITSTSTQATVHQVLSQGFARSTTKSSRNELELQNTSHLGVDNRLVWGGSVRQDYAEYALLLDKPRKITPWQLFAHDEWRIGQSTVLNIGTMFENNGMGHKNNSPRASLNYHFTPQHTVRVSFSTATRSPVMSEAFIAANNTIWGGVYVPPVKPLKPEKIFSKEIGYLGEFRSIGITVDTRAYIEQVKDQIWWDKFVRVTTDYADSWANLLSTKYRGVDATVKYHWDEGHSFSVLSYAYQQASAKLGSTPTQYYSTTPELWGDFPTIGDLTRTFYNEEYLRYFYQTVPKHTASLLVSQQLADSFQLSVGYYYRTLMRVADVSPNSVVNSGVTPELTMRRIDLRLAKTFKHSNGKNTELAIVIQNATRDNYTKYGTINPVSQVTFSRRGWITASFDL